MAVMNAALITREGRDAYADGLKGAENNPYTGEEGDIWRRGWRAECADARAEADKSRGLSDRETIIAEWRREGFKPITSRNMQNPLYRFDRGDWTDRWIAEVRIDPNGVELWIKPTPGWMFGE